MVKLDKTPIPEGWFTRMGCGWNTRTIHSGSTAHWNTREKRWNFR